MKILELLLTKDGNGEGITAISLVKRPAIEQNWITFSQEQGMVKPNPAYKFKTLDVEKRIIAGPAMVPDKLIFRLDADGEEFFVFFKADTIRELSERFLLQGRQNNMTLEHDATINDLSVVESWLVEDPKRDKSSLYGFDLPVGSWFVKIKVLNDDIWRMVKSKDIEGFSVEGVFANELIKQNKEMKNVKKSKLDVYLSKISGLFTEDEEIKKAVKFDSIIGLDTKGEEVGINYEGEVLEVGIAISTTVEDTEIPVPVGEYVLPDGTILVVAEEGIVSEILPAKKEEDEELKDESGLKGEQIDALVEGIAEIISKFRSEIKEDVKSAVAKNAASLRNEFNKSGDTFKKETPAGMDKKIIISGLNKFVTEANKK